MSGIKIPNIKHKIKENSKSIIFAYIFWSVKTSSLTCFSVSPNWGNKKTKH